MQARSVRLISADGEQLGIKHIREATDYAERQDLDLVESPRMRIRRWSA